MFKDNLKRIRTKRNLSQRELGRRINKTGQYISYLENTNKSNPGLEVINKIADTLDVTVADLVDTPIEINGKPFIHNKEYLKEFGLNVKKYREKNGLTQKEFAAIIHSNETMVQLYEDGYKLPGIKTCNEICSALGIKLSTLLGPKQCEEINNSLHEVADIAKNIVEKINQEAFDGIIALAKYASLDDEINILSKIDEKQIFALLDQMSAFLEYELYKINKVKKDSKNNS